ncbi:MAG: DUF6797 domain-containing protein, partial [Pirellulaceae bacterium]
APAQSLDEELKRIPASQMAAAAREKGDAARGAVVFFQTHMACAKCHITGAAGQPTLGPDLTAIGGNQVTDEAIVESVLHPSKVIRAGYQSVTLVTAKGQSITALLVEQAGDRLVVRDVARGGETTVFQISELDSWKWNDLSIMPAGQVNQLNSRQQFLDLIRYLIEIRDGGPVRALQLQPPASLLTFTVPEYEKHIDHAGLIGDWNGESFQRGAAIYQRVCANCHGTVEKPGSLPSSLRFAEGKFKNGGDPLSMYRTLTHGFGLMAPQAWMVPSQKYDVIHYIRETYLRNRNPSQFIAVTAAYLRTLPAGSTRGPDPSPIVPWSAMDYGPSLTHTFEVPGPSHNLAYKGIAIRLDPGAGGVSRGRHWMLFDTDTLRVSAAWNAASILDAGAGTQSVAGSKSPRAEDNFIDWRGIQFNGEHNVHPRLAGETAYANSTGPGWANPSNGKFTDDRRVLGRDGRRYGPLPRDWGRFRGLHHHGQDVVLSYAIGTTEILEWPRLIVRDEPNASPLFGRTFNIGPRDRDLLLQVAEHSAEDAQLTELNADGSVVSFGPLRAAAANDKQNLTLAGNTYLAAGFSPSDLDAAWTSAQGRLQLRLPAGRQPLRFTLWLPAYSATASDADLRRIVVGSVDPPIPDADRDLTSLTRGGPPRWPQKLETQVIEGADDGPFAADFLTAPETNPWLAQTRFTGLDFFPDGRIAVCTWDGDVWLVETLETQNPPAKALTLRWQRIASGMFQPLGLKIVHEKIHVICRDQLTVLHDRNGDNEIDFYECLNNDHQVTEHFHEFAMGLQTDAEGNFYYAKSGCHGKKAVVPHHGTLLRVSKDGSHTDILANGFRAANGVCVNPDGSFVVTDQEGFWNPKNRINWVTLNPDGRPNFYGNMLGYHDVTDASDDAMVPPLCWITNAFDRSPAEPLWVTSDRWGPLKSSLLNLSYGYGKVFLVMLEKVGDRMQGGMVELPIPAFPTGVMRGRFHPTDGQLYLCGMFAWAGNATHPGGLYRLRVTGRSMNLPVQLHATRSGLNLTFTEPLDPTSIDVKNLQVKTWSLKRTANYGSKHYDEKMVPVKAAALSNDGRALRLDVVDLRPNWCMEIAYTLRSQDGAQVQGIIHNTIHRLSEGGP